MGERLATVLLLMVAGASATTAPSLAGSWKLVTWTDTSESSGMPYYPFGTNPTGQFVFTSDGHFSAEVESSPNGALPPDLPRKDFDDLRGPFLGFFGTYRFDPATDELSLDVKGSSAPAYVMSDATRTAHFQGDRLVLSGVSVRRDGHVYSWERVLEKDNR